MTFDDFNSSITSLSEEELISYLEKHVVEVRRMFFNTTTNNDGVQICREAFLTIQRRKFSELTIGHKLFQGVINQLSILFKRVGDLGLLYQCRLLSRDKFFFSRIEAYIFYREYNDFSFYAGKLHEYLSIIARSLYIDGEDYFHEIVDDVLEYYVFSVAQLTRFKGEKTAASFRHVFLNKSLIEEFPFIEAVHERIEFDYQGLKVEDCRDQVFGPSDFSGDLFQRHFIGQVQAHTETRWPSILMGYNIDSIRQNILEYGLADFDQPYKKISPIEKVQLYCFLNMRKHFFTSLYLFECLPDIVKLYNGGGTIKFIDIGCGPGTSGLALLDHIHGKVSRPVVLDYIGIDISGAMLSQAESMFLNDIVDNRSQLIFSGNLRVIDNVSLEDSSCVIINTCYLFASENLNIDPLVQLVEELRRRALGKPLFMFYQNAVNPSKHTKYGQFKSLIDGIKVLYSSTATINYFTQRDSIYPPKGETAVFEILKLDDETA